MQQCLIIQFCDLEGSSILFTAHQLVPVRSPSFQYTVLYTSESVVLVNSVLSLCRPLSNGLWQMGRDAVGMRILSYPARRVQDTHNTSASFLWSASTQAFLSNTLYNCLFWSNPSATNVM